MPKLNKILLILLTLAVLGNTSARGQNVVSGGVLNAASYAFTPLPNSSVAQGSMFYVYLANNGPTSTVFAGIFPLPTSFGGYSVSVTVNGTTVQAIIPALFGDSRIVAVLPSQTPIGTGSLTVTFNGTAGSPAPITVVPSSFGMFALNQAGSGPAVLQDTSYLINKADHSANPGEVWTIWGTGVGPVNVDPTTEASRPLPGDLSSIPVEVWVGNSQAQVTYRGRSGCCTGVDQVNFVVPNGLKGCNIALIVKIGNVVSNAGTMAIAPSPSRTCQDDVGLSAADLQSFLSKSRASLGAITLSRLTAVGAQTVTIDSAAGSFFSYDTSQLSATSPAIAGTTYGNCSVVMLRGGNSNTVVQGNPQGLDAGPSIGLSGPKGSQTVPSVTTSRGSYSASWGLFGIPAYLDPGAYTAAGPAGSNVGAFTANATVPSQVTWTNQTTVGGNGTDIDRTQPLTVTWTGGDPNGIVNISGTSSAQASGSQSTAGAQFTCAVQASAGQFVVPPYILLGLPPSATINGVSTGVLEVVYGTPPSKFTATGLDAAYVTTSAGVEKLVVYH